MATSAWDKFVLLLWKNWKIQIRHKVQTVFEVLIPVLCCAILLLVRGLAEIQQYDKPTYYQPISIGNLDRFKNITMLNPFNFTLAYSPMNDKLEELIQKAATKLDFEVIGLENATELERYAMDYNLLCGIEFNDTLSGITELPNNLTYTIRFPSELRVLPPFLQPVAAFAGNWRTEILFDKFLGNRPRNLFENDGGTPSGYAREGFLEVQNAIETSFISLVSKVEIPEVMIQRYPYPAFILDPVLQAIEMFLPLLMVLSFLFVSINTIKYITVEKEKQLKESMKIMGLPNWLHWTAWFTKCMVFMIIICSLITLLYKLKMTQGLALLQMSDWSVVWVFLITYSISAISYSFMFSVFFSKASTAATIGGVCWFLFYFPYAIIFENYSTLSLGVKLIVCLFSNSAMSMGFKLLVSYEGSGTGAQWSNLFSPPSVDDNMTLGYIILMFFLTSTIYMLIALYVEKIFPGEFGIAEKWYFPFTKKYWTGKSSHKNAVGYENGVEFQKNIETDPLGKIAGIEIRGLSKIYDNNKIAVKSLHLNMFEDQITVLLGHNGAGKTTTMSMLTGLFPPTSGTAIIDGKDIRYDMDQVRESLGICPQHNVLFDELTVEEHIIFFSRLKRLSNEEIQEEIKEYVDLLELTPKKNAQSKTLSGGMKRKLSVGVALCGRSRIVMLDEPTSGMDPAARRALWDILIKEKKNRTILLSTHFMDEAEILGDRIAIMAEGDLKAAGTTFFLKKLIGLDYRLVCVKDSSCVSQKITEVLAKFIPEIHVATEIGSELTYILPDQYSNKFREILTDFEEKAPNLGVSSFGISPIALEDVFLKVGADSKKSKELVDDSVEPIENGNGNHFGSNDLLNLDALKLKTGLDLFLYQIWAMFLKKFVYTIRNVITLIIQFLIPVVFLIMTMATEDILAGNKNLPELPISMLRYLSSVTVLQSEDFGEDTLESSIAKSYEGLKMFKMANYRVVSTKNDIQDYILQKYNYSVPTTNMEYVVGASITRESIIAWFNNQGFHTIPLTLNMMNNAILKAVAGAEKGINLINNPLPYTLKTREQQLQIGNNLGFNIAMNSGFAMSFVSAMFVMFYIKERVSRSKLLQIVSGVNKFIYWTVSFLFDYVHFLIIVLAYLGVLAAYQKDGFSTIEEHIRFFIIFLLFGFSMLPMTYLGSFIFSIPSTGLIRFTLINLLSGTFFFMTYFILNLDMLNLKEWAEGFGWFFLLFPHYSLSRAFSNLNVKSSLCKAKCDLFPLCDKNKICEIFSDCCPKNFYNFEETGIGKNLIAMTIMGFIFFAIIYAKDYRINEYVQYSFKKFFRPKEIPETEEEVMDSDVKDEKMRIKSLNDAEIKNSNLILKNMTKFYKNQMAVNQLCVGINENECFGLLGVNGAGKTSTFKMLTGDEIISDGEAWVKGISIKTGMIKVHRKIGYCPQFDALLEDLTGRESLKIFCLLRGVPRSQIHNVSMQLAMDLNFVQHLDKRIKAFSGGNKRKLSTSLALIGNPSVIYLDEPTTGMDPGARRQLWNTIMKIRESGKSVVLTSHSMEECEALCTRLAIMVNGEFKCLGSTQHLKNKFSNGFILTIKAGKAVDTDRLTHLNQIKTFVRRTFLGANLKEAYMDILTYYIPNSNLKWSVMFGIMEDAKKRLNIEDYSLGQTSLEQIFLLFTKFQRADS